MKYAGVIGFPISHSKSPLIYNYWLKKYGIDGKYDKYAVEDVGCFFEHITEFVGLNVTVPHKTAVMPFMNELSEQAQKAGAVNTIVVRKNGELYGHNTDGIGFLANVMASEPSFDLENSVVTVLGTGGASRGVCAALTKAKEVQIVYRTLEKAENIAKSIGGKITLIPWAKRQNILYKTDLLVNATTLGMDGFDKLIIDLSELKENAVVSDLVYSPLETDLLKQAHQIGFKTADGLGMLLEQARPAFQAFFGIFPQIDQELRDLVAK